MWNPIRFGGGSTTPHPQGRKKKKKKNSVYIGIRVDAGRRDHWSKLMGRLKRRICGSGAWVS